MTSSYLAAELHPVVESLVRRGFEGALRGDRERLVLDIDSRDEMFANALEQSRGDREHALFLYFSAAIEVAGSIFQLLDDLFPEGVEAVLDFGCGYGRVTRFLAAAFADAPELWASDVLAQALEFQRRRFAVRTFPSCPSPDDLRAPRRYDLIYVGSLFTHLPDATFYSWLQRLTGWLRPRGVLVFTVHDTGLMPPHHRMPKLGLCFEAASESRTLDPNDYGSSWVMPDYVERQIARLGRQDRDGEGPWRQRRVSRGLCNYQDLHLVARDDRISRLSYDGGPFVRIERCSLDSGGALEVAGWAVSRFPGFQDFDIVLEVETGSERSEIGRARPEHPRPDCFQRLADVGIDETLVEATGLDSQRLLHSGWSCRCPLPRPYSGSSLRLVVRADSGRASRIVFAGPLDRLLFLVSEENRRRQYDRTFQGEEVIAAMKSSRFWALRRNWFRLKRALGWTEER